MKRTTTTLVTIVTIALLTLVAFFLTSPKSINELKRSVAPTASLYPEGKMVTGVLNFVDDNNSIIHLSEASNDKWVLLYFGYVACPNICPTDLAKISQALHKMEEKESLQVVFISIDPNRDIGKLNGFAKGFNSAFIGLSAHSNELITISKTLGVYHQVVAAQQTTESDSHAAHSQEPHEHYELDHTTSYLLLNPELTLTAILSSPHQPTAMAKALDEIIKALR